MQSLRIPPTNERRTIARRAQRIVAAAVVGVSLAAGCGGQSELHSDEGDGASGSAGTGGSASGGGGTTGTGASPSGGIGASPSGGVAGTTPAGGNGGTSFGGTSSGGVAGTSGSSGAGGVCSLPLVTGSCNAYFPSFGFSQADQNCQPFVYGGCEGNDNRFSTLADCEKICGGSLSNCPAQAPWNQSCGEVGQTCTYDFDDCLCAPKAPYLCTKIDPACTRPGVDGGVEEIVAVLYNRCTCGSDSSSSGGTWTCNYVTANQ